MSIIELPPEMAPGFRFYPTDEELIKDYLKPKLLGEDSEVDHVVAEVDFCNIEPWNLPLESKIKSKDRMWWFFCVQRLKLVKKSSKKKAETESANMIWKITGKKKTGTGSWKITGKEKEIKDQNTGECIGKKRTLVFDKTHNKNKKWVMQEFYIIPGNPLPNQSIYVLRRLKEKPNNKVQTPDGGEGEPSGDIRSEVENSATPAAISSAHGNEQVNQELLPQPLNSPVCELTDDEISLLSSVGFFRGHNETQALCGTGEREELPHEFLDSPAGGDTNAEGVDVESPHAICHLEKKTDERAGGLGCHEGEPGSDIIDDMNNPVAPAVISEEHGREEVNADLLSQSLLSPDYCLTEEDIRLLFSGCPSDGQQFNSGMHKYNPESANYVPHKGPYAISGSENITDEVTGNLGCDIVGKPSGYITSGIGYQAAPAATLEVHANTEVNGEYLSPDYYLTEEDICSIFAGSFSDGYNNSQALCGADEPEESPAEFLEGLKVKSDENFCGKTTSTLFNDSIQPKSLKRSCPLDGPARVDTDVGGVDGRVKRPRSLALGESLQ